MPSRLPPALRPFWPLAKRGVVRTTRVLAPLTSDLSRVFGPSALPTTASTDSTAFITRLAGAAVETMVPAQAIRRGRAQGYPQNHHCFVREQSVEVPEAFVARIPHGRAVSRLGAVVAPGNTLLFDLSHYFGVDQPKEHPIYLRLRLPRAHRFHGRLGVLDCRGVNNYCHFLLDVLPRHALLEAQDGFGLDAYYVPRRLRFQQELLELVGVMPDHVLDSSQQSHVVADQLVVPSLPAPCLEVPSWTVTHLRSRLLPAVPRAPRQRLYVTRGRRRHSRRVQNEDDVLRILSRRGFVAIDPGSMSVPEQIALFRSAEAVVAPHGSALANLVFCPPETAIVELFAPDYVNICYWALASQVPGLRYRYLLGEGRQAPPDRRMLGIASDITVSTALLQRTLDELEMM